MWAMGSINVIFSRPGQSLLCCTHDDDMAQQLGVFLRWHVPLPKSGCLLSVDQGGRDLGKLAEQFRAPWVSSSYRLSTFFFYIMLSWIACEFYLGEWRYTFFYFFGPLFLLLNICALFYEMSALVHVPVVQSELKYIFWGEKMLVNFFFLAFYP